MKTVSLSRKHMKLALDCLSLQPVFSQVRQETMLK